MSEGPVLKALSRETKALIIVSEFEARRMPLFQLRGVLNELVTGPEEKKAVIDLVENDLKATGYHPNQITAFLQDLLGETASARDIRATRRLRSPFALGFEEDVPGGGAVPVSTPAPPGAPLPAGAPTGAAPPGVARPLPAPPPPPPGGATGAPLPAGTPTGAAPAGVVRPLPAPPPRPPPPPPAAPATAPPPAGAGPPPGPPAFAPVMGGTRVSGYVPPGHIPKPKVPVVAPPPPPAAASAAAQAAPETAPAAGVRQTAPRKTFFFGSRVDGLLAETAASGLAPKHKVLLADDDKRIRIVFRMTLERLNCNVVEAGDGHEAWKVLQEGDIELAVLDMKMPGLHGLEVLSRMVDKHITPPVIICSAYDQLKDEFLVASYPNLRYLVKPVSAEALEKAVHDLLGLAAQ